MISINNSSREGLGEQRNQVRQRVVIAAELEHIHRNVLAAALLFDMVTCPSGVHNHHGGLNVPGLAVIAQGVDKRRRRVLLLVPGNQYHLLNMLPSCVPNT